MRRKTSCTICKKLISYSNMSRHMFIHADNNPLKEEMVCECGANVCKFSYIRHMHTMKHKSRLKKATLINKHQDIISFNDCYTSKWIENVGSAMLLNQ